MTAYHPRVWLWTNQVHETSTIKSINMGQRSDSTIALRETGFVEAHAILQGFVESRLAQHVTVDSLE